MYRQAITGWASAEDCTMGSSSICSSGSVNLTYNTASMRFTAKKEMKIIMIKKYIHTHLLTPSCTNRRLGQQVYSIGTQKKIGCAKCGSSVRIKKPYVSLF
jgi:hypothetical protein